MRVLGLMSGTSADGIDVALVRIAGAPPRLQAKLEKFATLPFPPTIRTAVLRIANGAATSTEELSQLNFALGEVFADTAIRACRKFRVSQRNIDLIGSHGQTVYHQGQPSNFHGTQIASTLQLGDPSVIAGRTGIITVGDFRPADMASGGQGAPLVPFVDFLLYRDSRRGRVALNIGGIANVTVIPAGAKPENVFAFDTGPGNMTIDALVRRFSRGRRQYDREARLALSGQVIPRLLQKLLADPYFSRRPPKSAGREQYGDGFAERLIRMNRKAHARPDDLIRTATLLTALSIVHALHRWVMPRTAVHQLIVSGGGAHNPLIMAQLAAALPELEFLHAADFGVHDDAKEAFAFAILAYETFHRRPANLPSATGARRPAILGKVCYAHP